MSKKKQKQLSIMLIIVGVLVVLLVGGILLNQWNTRRQEKAADAAAPRLVSMDEVEELTMTNDGTSLTFRKTEDGDWYWVDDQNYPLNDTVCTSIENLVSDFTAEQQMDISDSLSAYGLENPAQSLTITSSEGEAVTILVGGETTTSLYYAMLEGGDQIYTIGSSLTTNLSKSLYDMAQLAEYPKLSSDIILNVTVAGQNTEAFTVNPVEAEAETEGDSSAPAEGSSSSSEPETTTEYHWFRNGTDVTEEAFVTSFRTELDTISMSALAFYKPTDEEREACGLTAPTAVVTVEYTSEEGTETSVLTIGGQTEDGSYYCTLDTNPEEIYTIAADSLTNTLNLAENGFDAAVTAEE